ncbi:LacI family DNA-binding transcriptional regulator [Sporomusa sp.]|uniref:LacI family DNA-binding transcriptional regulator n=1 Tax=Sporomusa sp. TaxID=2078658 RepID=UPI002BA1DDBE|nr:LacI family DNA-binding transcriptional regulator [Sporomusa sp.]HWR41892.1 LacI family DNA-binding transcriptional regulator [Sporomusa sp.]
MSDIRDVAKLAGVSPSTVSRVLNGKIPVNPDTKEKVLAAIKELNYQPNAMAQVLKGGRINTIGLFLPNVRNLVFPAVIQGIEDTAKKHGYIVVVCNTDEDVEKEKFYIENLRRRLVDGFIFCTARAGTKHLLELQDEGFPHIYLIRKSEQLADAVILDNYAGACLATEYLVGQGHRRIALINGPRDVLLFQDRFAGYKDALAKAGIALDENLIIHDIHSWDDGYQAMVKLLALPEKPDAVFATSDPKAIGAIQAIVDAGLAVPQDISVMGFDDSDPARMTVPLLTTVAQPFYEMGAKACERLIKNIEGKRNMKPKIDVFPAELVIRKSVK